MKEHLDQAEQYGKLSVLYKTMIFLQGEIKKEEKKLGEIKKESGEK